MGTPITTVDAFTDVRYSGNPAGVCILPKGEHGADWMQKVAREMNLPETAYLVKRKGEGSGNGVASYDLRWFSPLVEIDLCGHATLASAHVLYEDGQVKEDAGIHFHTRSGVLKAEKASRGKEGWIELDFPALPEKRFNGPTEKLAKALGANPRHVGAYGSDYLVELQSEKEVRGLSPDFGLLKELPARGVAVTAPPGASTKAKGFDFVSRFFAPAVGIDEDPVTGSAHCALGPFWGRRLGKEKVTGYQASARGGTVRVRMRGDRVILGGKAVTVMRGELQ